jgi:NAD(P)-dependent dehydrogenase (short-subunit alcohol dehydrogenase family)
VTDDRLAIVTGTTAGIGLAVATDLLARGWRVLGLARRPSAIAHRRYEHVGVDLAEPAEAAATIERAVGERLGDRAWRRLGLVNNAACAGLLGPVEQVAPLEFAKMLALNVVTPVWLMGFVVSRSHSGAVVRIVNVSSGAAVNAFPGLSAYASSKAGLRMAGMVLAAEVGSRERSTPAPADVAILSYEPGTVYTAMQQATRAVPREVYPWVGMFHRIASEGLLVPPERPAAEIAAFLEGDGHASFAERRLGRAETT